MCRNNNISSGSNDNGDVVQKIPLTPQPLTSSNSHVEYVSHNTTAATTPHQQQALGKKAVCSDDVFIDFCDSLVAASGNVADSLCPSLSTNSKHIHNSPCVVRKTLDELPSGATNNESSATPYSSAPQPEQRQQIPLTPVTPSATTTTTALCPAAVTSTFEQIQRDFETVLGCGEVPTDEELLHIWKKKNGVNTTASTTVEADNRFRHRASIQKRIERIRKLREEQSFTKLQRGNGAPSYVGTGKRLSFLLHTKDSEHHIVNSRGMGRATGARGGSGTNPTRNSYTQHSYHGGHHPAGFDGVHHDYYYNNNRNSVGDYGYGMQDPSVDINDDLEVRSHHSMDDTLCSSKKHQKKSDMSSSDCFMSDTLFKAFLGGDADDRSNLQDDVSRNIIGKSIDCSPNRSKNKGRDTDNQRQQQQQLCYDSDPEEFTSIHSQTSPRGIMSLLSTTPKKNKMKKKPYKPLLMPRGISGDYTNQTSTTSSSTTGDYFERNNIHYISEPSMSSSLLDGCDNASTASSSNSSSDDPFANLNVIDETNLDDKTSSNSSSDNMKEESNNITKDNDEDVVPNGENKEVEGEDAEEGEGGVIINNNNCYEYSPTSDEGDVNYVSDDDINHNYSPSYCYSSDNADERHNYYQHHHHYHHHNYPHPHHQPTDGEFPPSHHYHHCHSFPPPSHYEYEQRQPDYNYNSGRSFDHYEGCSNGEEQQQQAYDQHYYYYQQQHYHRQQQQQQQRYHTNNRGSQYQEYNHGVPQQPPLPPPPPQAQPQVEQDQQQRLQEEMAMMENSNVDPVVQDTLNTTWTLKWHHDISKQQGKNKDEQQTPSNSNTTDSSSVNVWVERGALLNRGLTVVEPKLMWRNTYQPDLLHKRQLNSSTQKPYEVRLLKVCRIVEVSASATVKGSGMSNNNNNGTGSDDGSDTTLSDYESSIDGESNNNNELPSLDRAKYPFARKSCSFFVRTCSGDEYLFEAPSEDECEYIVSCWKHTVARLASLAVVEDMDTMALEFFTPNVV